MIATAVIGASNALRERAWDPGSMWGWADPLVEQATKAIYQKVFTRLRRRHALRGGALSALAVPPVRHERRDDDRRLGAAGHGRGDRAGRLAGQVAPTSPTATLITSLGVVHDAVGPLRDDIPADRCASIRTRTLQGPPPPGRSGQRHRHRDDALPQLAAWRAWLGRQRDRAEVRTGPLRRQVAHLGRGREAARQPSHP